MRAKSAFFAILALGAALFSATCGKSSPTEPTPACTYTLSPSSLSFGTSGGTGSVSVATGNQCTWSAASDRGWMSVTSGASGTGPGSVSVTIAASTSSGERTGTLTVAGQAVSVRQDGLPSCTVQISPASASFNKDAATGAFSVTSPEHCEWSALSSAAWLAVTSGSPGKGNGTVGYAIERNREVTERRASVTVADGTFTLTQAGDPPAQACEYSVSPIDFSPCMSAGYELTATITTQQGCSWTAAPDASWITMTGGQSGIGSGLVRFRVSDNWDAPRQSVVKVRWPTVTAGQNLQVRQAGCHYAVSTNSISIAAAGGTGRFDVIQQSDPIICGGATQDNCVWTALADVPWITVTTPMPQAGDDPVSFTVAPNTTGTARIGTITVRGQIVRVTQGG